MTIRVRGPDGATVNFPDGTSPAVMQQAMSRHYGTPSSGYGKALNEMRGQIAQKGGTGALAGSGRSFLQGLTYGVGNQLAGLANAGGVALDNALGRNHGYSPADAYHATVDASRQAEQDFGNAHPILNTGANIAGAVLAPGTGVAARFVGQGLAANAAAKAAIKAGQAAPSLLGSVARAANAVARPALAGGVLGAATGAGNTPGGLAQRAQGALNGAEVGATTGAVVPVAAAGAGALARTLAPTGTAIARTANRALGGTLLDPQKEAAKRIMNALLTSNASPDAIRAASQSIQDAGGVTPSVLDVVNKADPVAGQNLASLVGGAAMKGNGQARGIVTNYANNVADNLQDAAIARTRQLTPDNPATAAQYSDQLSDTQGQLADQQYAQPYQTPVQLTPQLAGALADQPGASALASAGKAAIARRNYPQADEIATLRAANPDLSGLPPQIADQAMSKYLAQQPPVTAGTLDRVRIAMRNAGQAAQQNPKTQDVASGLFGRMSDIDSALDQVPELAPARATYAAYGANQDALQLGQDAVSKSLNPTDVADQLAGYTGTVDKANAANAGANIPIPNAAQSAGVGYRDAAVTRLGSQPDGATGALNRLVNTNSTGYQDAIFGPDAGQSYRDSIGNMIDQMNIARRINPNAGSDTSRRLLDANLVDVPSLPTTTHGMIAKVIDKVRQGAGLTDDERDAIAGIGTSQDPQTLDDLLSQFVQSKPYNPALPAQVATPITYGVGAAYADQNQ